MLKSIDIRNFQSHEKTHIDLAAGVNVFVGTSDSGKSAVLRALLWLATNRPGGDAFRSTWGGDTAVKAETGDEHAVSRYKGRDGNKYSLDLPDPDGQLEFKAMGQDVPAEVAAALNLPDVCVQHQMDSPFLLSRDWSPGRVAEYLNEVAGLDAIDRAQAGINAKARQITADIAREEAGLTAKQAERQRLDYLQDFEKELVRVETASVQASVVRRDEQELNAVVVEIVGLRERIAGQPDWLKAERDAARLFGNVELRDMLSAKEQDIKSTLASIENVGQELTDVNITVSAEPQVLAALADDNKAALLDDDANALTVLTTDIIDLSNRAAALSVTTQGERLLGYIRDQVDSRTNADHLAASLENLLGDIHAAEDSLAHNGEELTDLEAEWTAVAPDVCPLCDGAGTLKPQTKLIDSERREYRHGTSKD